MVACLSRCLYLFFNFVIPNGSYRNTESRTSFHIVTSEHTFLTSVYFQHLNLHCKLTKSMNFPYPIRLRVEKRRRMSAASKLQLKHTQHNLRPHRIRIQMALYQLLHIYAPSVGWKMGYI